MAAYYKPPASFSEYAAGQPPPSLQQPGLHYQEQQHHQHNYDHPAILQSGSAAASPHHYQQQGYHGPLPRPPPQQQPWQAPPSYAHLNEETLSRLPAEDGARDSRSQLDDGVTLAPYDSISNVGYDEGSESGGPQQPPRPSRFSQVRHSATGSTSKLPLLDDDGAPLPLYARASSSQNTGRARRADAAFGGNGNSDSEESSVVDGDTVTGASSWRQHKSSKGRSGAKLLRGPRSAFANQTGGSTEDEDASYPPTPYDSIALAGDEKPGLQERDVEEAGSTGGRGKANILVTIKGENKERPNVWLRQIRDTTPMEQKIENHRRGIGVQDRPWACWVLTTICVIVFIVELVRSSQVTGKAIATSPFNYMIGPSSEMLINLGARFTGCMREVPAIQNVSFACLNSTTTICSLEEICGFGGFKTPSKPDQTFRFFTPMWLHVGVVHLLINMLVLMTSSALVEKQMGSLRFLILYTVCGVFGFVLGGNFALSGLASMGASGAIFGTHAAVLVDLLAHWSIIRRPARMLLALLFEIIVGIGIGYIPGVDNFSHIGGFAMGLLLATVLLPMIHQTRARRMTVYFLRSVCLVGACVMLGVLVNNFFTSDPNSACEWCRYLSCWPTANNNRCQGTGLTMTTTTTTTTPTGTSGSSGSGTVGSQVNGGLALTYLVMFFSGSAYLRHGRVQ